VEVVDEPFRGGCDRAFVLDRLCQRAIGLQEDAAVLGDAAPDRAAGPRLRSDGLRGGKRLAVLLEAFDAEDFGDDRFRVVGLAAACAADADQRLPSGFDQDPNKRCPWSEGMRES
jgi:hypothetical protein